jgi:CheY-like chemotaxis protein
MVVDLLMRRSWKWEDAAIDEMLANEIMVDQMIIDQNNSGETLPSEAVSSKAIVEAALAASCQSEGRQTILLVEDEVFVRKVTAEVLESAGYRLVTAESATEALEICRRCLRPLDLLFADVVMPGMSGRELAIEFASFYPHARVLLMSGYAEQFTGCEVPSWGQEYLAKPFSISKLLSRVREVLDKPVHSEGCAKPP